MGGRKWLFQDPGVRRGCNPLKGSAQASGLPPVRKSDGFGTSAIAEVGRAKCAVLAVSSIWENSPALHA